MKNVLAVMRSAFSRLSVFLVLKQIGLAVLVFLLAILWLNLSDAGALQVAFTVVLALVILFLAGAGESWIVLSAARRSSSRAALLRGAIVVLVGLLLWFGWATWIDHLRENDGLRAGYLNSRMPHSLRNLFSYEHIFLSLRYAWTALEWLGSGVIAAAAFSGVVAQQPLHHAGRILRSAAFWISLVVAAAIANAAVDGLIYWLPGRGLRWEMVSVVLRLSAAVIVEAAVACYLLALFAVVGEGKDARADGGTPEDNQPRTAAIP